MRWYGLTGSIGSGKSTVARIFQLNGLLGISADDIVAGLLHSKTQDGVFDKVVEAFGDIILAKGEIHHATLAKIVFHNQERLETLEKIIHPKVFSQAEKLRRKLEGIGREACFYEVPLLFEKKMESQFDATILVTTTTENLIKRVCKRNSVSKEDVLARLDKQMPVQMKVQKATYVIENNGSEDDLERDVLELLETL